MTPVTLVMAESGGGKSSAIRNLPPKETFIINVDNKPLPYKGWRKNYIDFEPENKSSDIKETLRGPSKGNLIATKNASLIILLMKHISELRPEIKYIVIDDAQYIQSFEYIGRINEVGWNKFNDILVNMVNIVENAKKLRDDMKVFILSHTEDVETGFGQNKVKAKTLGKAVDKYVTYEGLFTTVLLGEACTSEKNPEEVNYHFITRKVGTTAKAPSGMFEDVRIPNDLAYVAKAIDEYEN